MSEYLEMPWSIEDTIENMIILKEVIKMQTRNANIAGKGEEDAKEAEFDFNRAIEALEKTRWIPCSERLPDKNGNYLVTICSYDDTASIEFVDVDHCNSDGKFLHYENRKPRKKEGQYVVAWMPAPEPYREGEENV